MQPAQDRLGEHDNTLAETMPGFLILGRRWHCRWIRTTGAERHVRAPMVVVEHAKCRRDGHEEVTRDNGLGAVSKKRRPALIFTWATRRPLGHVLAHCPWRYPHPELE